MSGPLDSVQLTRVDSFAEAENLLSWLGERRDVLGFDCETGGLNVGREPIRLIQFGDLEHGWALDYADWRGVVKEVFQRYDRPMVAHNILFDSKFLARDKIPLQQHLLHDSMIMAHITDPRYPIKLESVAARLVDRRAWSGARTLRTAMQKGGWDWRTIPTDHPAYWAYGALDGVLCAHIFDKLAATVLSQFKRVYETEMACIRVMRDAELRGMRIDVDYTRRTHAQLVTELADLRPQIPVNPSSEPQLVKYLQNLGAVLTKKTEKGKLSVDDEVLTGLEPRFPIAGTIRDWRKRDKLRSSYFENLLEQHDDGIVRPSVKPVGARTGRMSVTSPALQTLPRGTIVRDCFIPSAEDSTLVLADYQQAEYRVLASMADEENLIAGFERGDDAHNITTRLIYKTDDFTNEQRQVAKNGNFAVVYCAGVDTFAHTARIPVEEARDFMDEYHRQFPAVRTYMDKVIAQVRNTAGTTFGKNYGYVETILGRRLPVEVDEAYKGVNYIIQPSATADVIKKKIVEVDSAGLGEFFRLPVHDELIFDVPNDVLQDVVGTIQEVMPERELFRVPLEIDVDCVQRWGDHYRN